MDFEIVLERGHYNVYLNEVFKCSCDNYQEACEEIEEMRKENKL